MYTQRRKDPHLDDFLKRVENIDSKKDHSKDAHPITSRAKPRAKRGQYSEDDLERSRRLLNADNAPDILDEMVVDNSDYDNRKPDNLAYRSAYNFEKTFSPKKSNYTLKELDLEPNSDIHPAGRKSNNIDISTTDTDTKIPGKFVVSEEDYLLLQRLKKPVPINEEKEADELSESLYKPIKKNIPSRGKPRREQVKLRYDIEIDVDAPSLPPRKIQIESDKSSDEENDTYERRFNKIHKRNSSPPPPMKSRRHTDSVEHEMIEIDSDSSNEKPDLPTRIRAEPKLKPTLKPKPELKSKPELKLKSELSFKDRSKNISDSETNNTHEENLSKDQPQQEKPLPPVSRSKTDPVSFLTSLNNNKLTVSHMQAPETPQKKQTMHLDYLDSVQMKSPSPQTSPSYYIRNSPIRSSKTNPSSSESFIDSSIKSTQNKDRNSSPIVKPKPILPSKPKGLKDIIEAKLETNESRVNNEVKPFKLRSVEKIDSQKIPPKVPPKSNNFTIPTLRTVKTDPINPSSERKTSDDHKVEFSKLRSLGSIDTKKDKITSTSQIETSRKNTSTPPIVPKRKPTVPEALLKASSLKKHTKGSTDDVESTILPEALNKRNTLQKTKTAPDIPSRKISMPEALKRASMLKKTEELKESKPDDSINSRIEQVMKMHQQRSLNSPSEASSIASSYSRNNSTGSITRFSSADETSDSSSLVHITKSRTRGPKRKPPTKI